MGVLQVFLKCLSLCLSKRNTAWKVSKNRVFSGPYFPVFGLNTGKYGPEKTPYLDIFHAVIVLNKCFIPATYLLDLSLCEFFFQRSVLKFEAKHWVVWKVSKYGVFSWSVFSRIQSECEKIRTRKSSVFGNFSRSVVDCV